MLDLRKYYVLYDNTPPQPASMERQEVAAFKDEFETFVRRLQAQWNAELDTAPISTDDGNMVLRRAEDELLNLASRFISDSSGFSTNIDSLFEGSPPSATTPNIYGRG